MDKHIYLSFFDSLSSQTSNSIFFINFAFVDKLLLFSCFILKLFSLLLTLHRLKVLWKC